MDHTEGDVLLVLCCLWYQCGDAPCSSHTGSNHHDIPAGVNSSEATFTGDCFLYSCPSLVSCVSPSSCEEDSAAPWLVSSSVSSALQGKKTVISPPTTTEPHLTLQLIDGRLTCGCDWSAARSNDWSWSEDQRHLEELRRRRRSWETAGQTEHIIMTNRKDRRQISTRY